ncbi:MAG: GGDEF domain-containing protein [Lachnospiraceae bacterium]|nr:GGDEF domain-containing protein [Lachnospiraceae bacterium]
MAFGTLSLEKRLKENIKNYSVEQLLDTASLTDYLVVLAKVTGISFLVVDRHGEKEVCVGNFAGFRPDVVNAPGRKIRVYNRTVAHMYVKEEDVKDSVSVRLVETIVRTLSEQATRAYEQIETSIYADELEKLLEKEQYRSKHGEYEDALTGTLNSTYFESRLKDLDEEQTIPVGVICVNINDWKYADDTYGHEESDRLIRTVAHILKEEAKEGYVIARCGGDLFHILIPYAREGESESYVNHIQEACNRFEDPHIAPSIACGIAVKYNVEQPLSDLISDAEYEMFNNKIEIKNASGYRQRLEKITL